MKRCADLKGPTFYDIITRLTVTSLIGRPQF